MKKFIALLMTFLLLLGNISVVSAATSIHLKASPAMADQMDEVYAVLIDDFNNLEVPLTRNGNQFVGPDGSVYRHIDIDYIKINGVPNYFGIHYEWVNQQTASEIEAGGTANYKMLELRSQFDVTAEVVSGDPWLTDVSGLVNIIGTGSYDEGTDVTTVFGLTDPQQRYGFSSITQQVSQENQLDQGTFGNPVEVLAGTTTAAVQVDIGAIENDHHFIVEVIPFLYNVEVTADSGVESWDLDGVTKTVSGSNEDFLKYDDVTVDNIVIKDGYEVVSIELINTDDPSTDSEDDPVVIDASMPIIKWISRQNNCNTITYKSLLMRESRLGI